MHIAARSGCQFCRCLLAAYVASLCCVVVGCSCSQENSPQSVAASSEDFPASSKDFERSAHAEEEARPAESRPPLKEQEADEQDNLRDSANGSDGSVPSGGQGEASPASSKAGKVGGADSSDVKSSAGAVNGSGSARSGEPRTKAPPAWASALTGSKSKTEPSQNDSATITQRAEQLRSARASAKKAQAHLAAARRAGKNSPQRVYKEAIAGWQLVAPHVDHDKQCRALAEALEKELRKHGEAANRAAGRVDLSKVLITE